MIKELTPKGTIWFTEYLHNKQDIEKTRYEVMEVKDVKEMLKAQAEEIFDKMDEKIRAFTLKRTGQQEVMMMMEDLRDEYKKQFGVDG